MVNTGLLILTNPSRIMRLLPAINEHVFKTLYIQYFPEKNILMPGNCSFAIANLKSPLYSHLIANIYALTSSISHSLDIRVLLYTLKYPNISTIITKKPIELVIFDQMYSNKDANTFIQDCLSNISMGCKFITLENQDHDTKDKPVIGNELQINDSIYKNVVLGGTFDRLHNGHKIFLSEAILRCSEKLTIGVTDEEMIKKKILWELIEPCATRMSKLKDFAEDVDPHLKFNIIQISDMFGPTRDDPNFDMIVVSEETKKGGQIINEERIQRKLKKLQVHLVKVLEDSNYQDHEESKLSSSNCRMRILGTRLKEPNLDDKPLKPYIIGLTGGIASGKSSVANKLKNLGAALINCDIVAHSLYEPGKKCFNTIVEEFGREYVGADGQIDRKLLGALVFKNQSQLEKLNKILWPAILDETIVQIRNFGDQGYKTVIIEAAVLIQAGWQSICHEVWTCIIPEHEAIKRLMDRNHLSEEDAKNRIMVQPSNVEQVKHAHVVISTLWSYELTQQQVEKAWKELQCSLEKLSKK